MDLTDWAILTLGAEFCGKIGRQFIALYGRGATGFVKQFKKSLPTHLAAIRADLLVQLPGYNLLL